LGCESLGVEGIIPRMKIRYSLFAFLSVAMAVNGYGQSSPRPTELGFLSAFGEVHERYPYEEFGQATFSSYGAKQVTEKGKHWNLWIEVAGAKDAAGAWAKFRPVAEKAGWTVTSVNPNGGFLADLHYKAGGVEAWMDAPVDESIQPPRFLLEIVEPAGPAVQLTLKVPGVVPEPLDKTGKTDFPWLPPLPGSVAQGGQFEQGAMTYQRPGQELAEVVAEGVIRRNYVYKDMSGALLTAVYKPALMAAGWEVLDQGKQDEVILAHFTKNGRNLWAYLMFGGESYSLEVGLEAPPDAMKKALAANCHVPLYGVLFDFNKATLQPVSDGILQQVAGLLKANPTLKVEVQGHTDNVGGDAYNQTLSEARAKSVMAWLVAHGISADRMTAKGYGKTRPVADNGTDEGRAKNRRVEIADPLCRVAGK